MPKPVPPVDFETLRNALPVTERAFRQTLAGVNDFGSQSHVNRVVRTAKAELGTKDSSAIGRSLAFFSTLHEHPDLKWKWLDKGTFAVKALIQAASIANLMSKPLRFDTGELEELAKRFMAADVN